MGPATLMALFSVSAAVLPDLPMVSAKGPDWLAPASTTFVPIVCVALKDVATGMVVNPSFSVPVKAILINKDAFNKLPKDIQEAMLRDSRHYFDTSGALAQLQHRYVIAEAIKTHGLVTYTWSVEDETEVQKLCEKTVWPFYASKSAECGNLLEIVLSHLSAIGRYHGNA